MPKTTFLSLQLATALPELPLGLVPVGRAYHVRPSTALANYAGGSIAFQYLGREVSQAYLPEENLAVYRWDGVKWDCVSCTLQIQNLEQNIVSAPLAGDGLYLLAGFQLTLTGGALNPIGYPLPYSLPVTKALAALGDQYTVIYHYDLTQPTQPWQAFGNGAPAWVNSLRMLKPNQSYWIYVKQGMQWSIDVGAAAATPEQPPSIFYGDVLAGADFTPRVGMAVTATMNGKHCGEAQTQVVDGRLVYVIGVQALEGCGGLNQAVNFTVQGRTVIPNGTWNNHAMQELDLQIEPIDGSGRTFTLHLPLIARP